MYEWRSKPKTDGGSVVRKRSQIPLNPAKGFGADVCTRPGSSNPMKRSQYTISTAKMEPSWMATSNVLAFGPVNPSRSPAMTKCPEEETGRNTLATFELL